MIQNHEIQSFLNNQGVDFFEIVDISNLDKTKNKGFSTAILLGIYLTPLYLLKVSQTPDYVEVMKRNNTIKEDEFFLMEQKTDSIADSLASFLAIWGFKSYSQSEKSNENSGNYDVENKSTPLPHKTIAVMAGLGWIGKHNLLVTPNFGSAISMCSVLTDAPIKKTSSPTIFTHSQCGTCDVCKKVCEPKVIKGINWQPNISREEIIDIFSCSTCLKCLVHCTYTQKYIKQNL